MGLDWSILQWIQSALKCDFMDFIMPKITLLGDGGVIWILAAVLLICTKKYRKHGVILLAGLALGVLAGNVCLKNLIGRVRPCWLDSSVHLLIDNPDDFSFPSGHTLSAVIAAAILTLTNRKFAFWAIPTAVLIAFSRLYLYVHFPSDILGAVLFGLIIGIVTFYAGQEISNWIRKKSHLSA